MKSDFDFDYRPETYWPDDDSPTKRIAKIKGAVRRKIAKETLEGEGELPSDDPMFEETLSGEDREAIGRLHPSFMGGEYLPDTEEDEVQIASIDLASKPAM
jgi:hypothetical protein